MVVVHAVIEGTYYVQMVEIRKTLDLRKISVTPKIFFKQASMYKECLTISMLDFTIEL